MTDHALPSDDPWFVEQRARDGRTLVDSGNFDAYVAAIDREAERAHTRYGMLLVPGLELTYNDLDPNNAAHAVAVGLRAFVPLDTGIFEALGAAREAGAALIAAHPHGQKGDAIPRNTTRRFWREWSRFAPLVDRVELFNQAISTAGSPRSTAPWWPAATSIAPSTSPPGRPSCPVCGASAP